MQKGYFWAKFDSSDLPIRSKRSPFYGKITMTTTSTSTFMIRKKITSSKRATPNFTPKSISESSTWFLFYLRKQCSPLALKIAHCKSNLLEINNFLEVSNVRPTLPLHWRPQQHQRGSILRPANEKKVATS